jgi:hypothetical protein
MSLWDRARQSVKAIDPIEAADNIFTQMKIGGEHLSQSVKAIDPIEVADNIFTQMKIGGEHLIRHLQISGKTNHTFDISQIPAP